MVAELTIEDFENLPEALAHNHELVGGELIDVSGNVPAHISLRDLLAAELLLYVRKRKLGKVLVEQDYAFGENAHGPDVSFLLPDKRARLEMYRRVQMFVPDLAIEVSSRNDRLDETMQKILRYREFGTKEVWLIMIRSRRAFLFTENDERVLNENDEFRSDLIPGFSIRLKDLFDCD